MTKLTLRRVEDRPVPRTNNGLKIIMINAMDLMSYAMLWKPIKEKNQGEITLMFEEVCSDMTKSGLKPKEVEDRPVPITNNGPKTILKNDKDMLSLTTLLKEKAMCYAMEPKDLKRRMP